MQLDRFVAERRERWDELDGMVRRAKGRGVQAFTGQELLRLGQLYRETAADLATARRDYPRDQLTVYLNDLMARAHPIIYRERAMDLGRIIRFWTTGFPATYRETLPYTAVAFGIFALAALVSAVLVMYSQSNADLLLPGTAQSLRAVMEQHHLWMKSNTSNHSVAANFIMINNIQVAFFAFAGGVLAGGGTVYVMIVNGINLGAIAPMVAYYGLSGEFWSFVAPHGVIELSVIFMAGGAGLRMGDALLRPGLRKRRDAFVLAARQAVALVVGTIPLLMVAGTIEGFFSASDVPQPAKYAVAVTTGILLYSYWLLAGRNPAPDAGAEVLMPAPVLERPRSQPSPSLDF